MIQFLVKQNNLAGEDSSCDCEGEYHHGGNLTRKRSTSLSISTSAKRGTSEGASSFIDDEGPIIQSKQLSSSEDEHSIEARLSHAINIAQQENCRPILAPVTSPYSTSIPVIDLSSSFSKEPQRKEYALFPLAAKTREIHSRKARLLSQTILLYLY